MRHTTTFVLRQRQPGGPIESRKVVGPWLQMWSRHGPSKAANPAVGPGGNTDASALRRASTGDAMRSTSVTYCPMTPPCQTEVAFVGSGEWVGRYDRRFELADFAESG